MKSLITRIAIIIVILITFNIAIDAAAPSATVTAVEIRSSRTSLITSDAADTLGITDSVTLVSNFRPDQGWEHIIFMNALTGTGSDSVVATINIQALDGSDVVEVTEIAVTSSASDAILIPFGSTIFAPSNKYTIKLVTDDTAAGQGGQLIINKFKMILRRQLSPDNPRSY